MNLLHGCCRLALVLALFPSPALLGRGRAMPKPPVPPPGEARLASWGQAYLEDWHRRHPALATLDGVHAFDDRLASFDPASIRAELRALEAFQAQLDAIPGADLPLASQLDRRLAQQNLAWRRMELGELRPWQSNPMVYAEEISNGLLWLTLYPTAPASERLKAIVARERQIPRLLQEARQNLQNPPTAFLPVAQESFQGLQQFVEKELPEAFKYDGTPLLRRDFRASGAEAGKAIADFLAWLERDLKPRATGQFVLGADRLARLLRDKEGITLPLDSLEAMGVQELGAQEARFRELCRAVDPNLAPREAWARQRRDHPTAQRLLPEVRQQVEALERFVRDRRLVAIPPHQPLVVAPTPAFLPGTFASQYMVGPFEPKRLPARYFVTLPDPAWSEAEREDHLGEYSRGALWSTSAHEAFPGHYLQGIYLQGNRSPFRAGGTFAADCLVEGWAHYCEQLMVDEGFLAADPRFALGQAKEAIQRACRFLVAIRLHTGRMTVDEATRFFMDHAFMAEGPARTEAERGTYEPTYLSYTYGKLGLMQLREEVRAREGAAFSLARFHERVLRMGQVPIWFMRAALLGERP